MPCLPGDPDVRVSVATLLPGTGAQVTSPCTTGQTPVLVKPFGPPFYVTVMSSGSTSPTISSPVLGTGDLPTVVIYTDAGYGQAAAEYVDAEDRHWCAPPGVTTIRFVVDGAPDATFVCNSRNVIGPFSAGPHVLRADGFDAAMNLIATSTSMDVDILAGAIGDVATVQFVP
jgi:hypothetical protein